MVLDAHKRISSYYNTRVNNMFTIVMNIIFSDDPSTVEQNSPDEHKNATTKISNF